MQNLRNSYVSPSGTSGFESKCVRSLTGRPLQPQHSRQRKSSLPLLFFSFHLYHPLSQPPPHSIILPSPNLYPPSLFFFLSPSIPPSLPFIHLSLHLPPSPRARTRPARAHQRPSRTRTRAHYYYYYYYYYYYLGDIGGMQGGIRGKLGKEAYRQALPRCQDVAYTTSTRLHESNHLRSAHITITTEKLSKIKIFCPHFFQER